MLKGFLLALAQMNDPAFRRAAFRSLCLTLLLLALLAPPFVWGSVALGEAALERMGWAGGEGTSAADLLSGTIGLVIWGGLAVLLFITISTAVFALYLDGVVVAVYARHHPEESPGTDPSIGRSIRNSIRFLLATLLLNLLALPLYVGFLFFPVLDLLLYMLINGYLLGREYFEVVALRHLPDAEAARLRKKNRTTLWLWGNLVSILFLVPILNFFAPLLSTAAMVHLYRRLRPPKAA